MSDIKQPIHNLPTPPPDSTLQPPPAYTSAAPVTPPPDITAAFSNLNLYPTPVYSTNLPSEDHCLAHLKLLEAISQLREDISSRDGLFGIRDAFATDPYNKEKQLSAIREKRWGVYVAKAVKRFEVWWMTCVEHEEGRLTMNNLLERFASFKHGGEAIQVKILPPLGKSSIIRNWSYT